MILQKYKLNISIKYYQIKECIEILNVVPNVVLDVVLNVRLLWDYKL